MNASTLNQNLLPIGRGPAIERLRQLARRTVRRLRAGLAAQRPAAVHLTLADDEIQWIRHPMGRELRCLEGRLWLTVERCSLDIVLDAGDSLMCDVDRPLLVQALGATRCVLN